MTRETSKPPSSAVLETAGLVLKTGFCVPDMTVGTGLTFIHASRETSATVLALTLAGRMKPKSGAITISGGENTSRHRFQHVALAGASEVDRLERLVPAWTVVREQLAWTTPWYRFTPRNLDHAPRVTQALERVGLDYDNDKLRAQAVGEMDVLSRLKLRTALALIARPEPALLIVDDIDQLRSTRLREQYCDSLRALSEQTPVLAISANGAAEGEQEIRITGGE